MADSDTITVVLTYSEAATVRVALHDYYTKIRRLSEEDLGDVLGVINSALEATKGVTT